MASIYENGPSKAGKESGMYERTPENGDEREDKTRLKVEDGAISPGGSNDGVVSPMVVSPEDSQAGGKRGREEDEGEAETEPANGSAYEANGNTINQDGGRKRQRVKEEPTRNGYPSQKEHKQPVDASQLDGAAVTPVGDMMDEEGGLESPNLEEDGSEEGEVEA